MKFFSVTSAEELAEKGYTVEIRDDELLADLGYKPELKRNFSTTQTFGIAFSIMGLLPSIASTLAFSLPAGPVGMVWGWFCASCCIMCVGLSMAELGSALPTSGGLYWWTYKFSPEKIRKPACFLAGYANTLGLLGGLVSIDYGFALMVLSVAVIGSDGTFEYNSYDVYGVFAGCIITHAIVGSLATKHMAKIQTACIVANIGVILITVIALPIGASSKRNNAAFIFGKLDNLSSWPKGWVFMLSWLSPIWTIGAFDSCVHMAEEASNAAVAVPLGIISSIGMCGILGFICLIVISATITPELSSVINTSFGQPMAQIYYDALGKKWTIAMMVMLLSIQWFMGLSIIVASSRQTWAFSRDGALPFSRLLKVVNYKLGVPVRAVCFNAICGVILGCLCLIDTTAANALFSLASASNSLAWLLPIAMKLLFGQKSFEPGPFYMGPIFTKVIPGFACVYLCFVIVLLMFPIEGPSVTPQNMNYTVVINSAVWLGALLYYFFDARKWFEGPQTTLTTEEIDAVLSPSLEYVDEAFPKKE
ncbi:amino acid transporter [Nadsonia fulvescens var. elongata DSM 6958]|uniref:Amino acid transporter n=1 Tax=Nadsonia fulvescens var. elongata DSM 6958 TaxID=857566 RepID=A0A1E3PR24_9ASCO|nr:amino acid transporter [Nadsonia fulvescens var. elongata DSM 6958]